MLGELRLLSSLPICTIPPISIGVSGPVYVADHWRGYVASCGFAHQIPEVAVKKPKKTEDDPDYDSNESSEDEDPFQFLPAEHSSLYHAIFYAFKVRRRCRVGVLISTVCVLRA